MSWLFSQALVEEYLPGTCWDGAPCAPLNVMPTQHRFWRNDRPMEYSRLSRFGLTCALLTADLGEELLTWFREDFLARTYQPQDKASELRVPDLLCGGKWQELSERYDLQSSTWRTHRCLWEEALPWSSVSLPKWGLTLSGELWEQQISEHRINEIVSGWLHGTSNRKMASRTWPTPVASMSKGSSLGALTRKSGTSRYNDRLDHAVMASDGGQLNPEWVEWLMGWPIGWTELKPLGMDKFQSWQQQHSVFWLDKKIGASPHAHSGNSRFKGR